MGRAVRYAAPGRVNLIGEHTDYNLGLALPIALPQRTVASYVPSSMPEHAAVITVRSDREPGEVSIRLDTAPGDVTGWAGYVAGVLWALRGAGHRVAGGKMQIASDVEPGCGLASSAALECAVLGALAAGCDLRIDRLDRALIARRAENDYVGAPTGLLDQLAALFGEPRRALLIDFRDTTVDPVIFDPDASGVALLLINSGTPHRHAGGEYAARRGSCERAAADLGVATLRDVQRLGPAALAAVADPVNARRARHVLTENQRVLDFVGSLSDSDYVAAGRILSASHESMRDDFEITTEEIDRIADCAVRAGALGARMTGGGFGGCVIALVHAGKAAAVGEAVLRATGDGGSATITRVRAAAGAAPLV